MSSNDLDYTAIGQRVRTARIRKGMQQADLAYSVGVSTTHMSHIETGKTKLSLPTAVKIANVLCVSVDALLCDNLEHARHVYDKEIAKELEDCDDEEIRAIREIIRSVKRHLQRHRKM